MGAQPIAGMTNGMYGRILPLRVINGKVGLD